RLLDRCFNPTLVRFKRLVSSLLVAAQRCFNPTLVRFKRICRPASICAPHSFNPTLVRFKPANFVLKKGQNVAVFVVDLQSCNAKQEVDDFSQFLLFPQEEVMPHDPIIVNHPARGHGA
ncbi:MAG: hypothetical protein Q9P90_14315, partial [candidate division KSB1 bacterium]|nr:hypothetical protein [candidate division KSB1 bacterium]